MARADDRLGYSYHVSDEQLRTFRSRSPAERLAWLEETRALLVELAPPRARRWWRRLRGVEPR
jgi:hypothetical protein